MKKNPFIPHPIDTSKISLPEELESLIEMLAKNTHDTWAKQRVEEGWKYGPNRNDEMKEHPCLVPYEELPENEKEYDRKTSCETLKVLFSLGYNVSKKK